MLRHRSFPGRGNDLRHFLVLVAVAQNGRVFNEARGQNDLRLTTRLHVSLPFLRAPLRVHFRVLDEGNLFVVVLDPLLRAHGLSPVDFMAISWNPSYQSYVFQGFGKEAVVVKLLVGVEVVQRRVRHVGVLPFAVFLVDCPVDGVFLSRLSI